MTGAPADDGYVGPLDSTTDTSQFNEVWFLVQQALSLVSTATLVQVKAVTNAGEVSPVGFVDVLPLVNQLDGDGNATPHLTVFKLPYFRLQGGTDAIICDPKVGDIGLASFADRDISSVKANKAQSNPGSRRRFAMSDGLYLGGFLNVAPEQYLRFRDDGLELVDKNGNSIVMGPGGITLTDLTDNVIAMTPSGVTITTPGNFVVNSVNATINASAIAAIIAPAINLAKSATDALLRLVTSAFVTLFNTHTHGGVTAGTGHTAVPDQTAGAAQETTIVNAE